MADIAVVYLSEDEETVGRLIDILRQRWSTWWAKEIAAGDWEEIVRSEIDRASALIPVFSPHATSRNAAILRDEIAYAQSKNKTIFPFLIGDTSIPFGLGRLSHTKAPNWRGDPNAHGCLELLRKIASKIAPRRHSSPACSQRPEEVRLGNKALKIPAFSFSLSSHETQVKPPDGMQLMELLEPDACLYSAYDHWKYYQKNTSFNKSIRAVSSTPCVMYLDSGNYEAYRKSDLYSKTRNPRGWCRENFLEVAQNSPADIVFSFDNLNIQGAPAAAANRIIKEFVRDARSLNNRTFSLCPIIHLPTSGRQPNPLDAAVILSRVAAETKLTCWLSSDQ